MYKISKVSESKSEKSDFCESQKSEKKDFNKDWGVHFFGLHENSDNIIQRNKTNRYLPKAKGQSDELAFVAFTLGLDSSGLNQ